MRAGLKLINGNRSAKANFALDKLSILELVKRCCISADQPAWREFERRFNRLIANYVSKAFNNLAFNRSFRAEEPEDFVQEVYLVLLKEDLKALKSFKGTSDNSFLAFLHTISIRVVAEYFRKQMSGKRGKGDIPVRSLESVAAMNELSYIDNNVDNTLIEWEFDKLLQHSLRGRNSERDRRIFKMHAWHAFTPSEIAAAEPENIRPNTVLAILERCSNKVMKTTSRLNCLGTALWRK
jgi:RNA polymerase sigma factor (sigma-70 family)